MAIRISEERKQLCLEYFENLVEELKESHVLVGSCNQDSTLYLVPKGSEDQITYHSKPVNSYRFSDHWNWYANTRRCPNPRYIQCFNRELPYARRRPEPGKPSRPVVGVCVAYFDEDNEYHTVFGERFNRKTKEWSFS